MADELIFDCATGETQASPIALLTLAEAKAGALVTLAQARWECEAGGIDFNGAPIKTDEVSARKLTSAYVKAVNDPTFAVRWKIGPGQFATLDAAAIIAIGDAVTEHVQQCFDREDVLTAAILDAEDQAELDGIDLTTGWP